MILVREVGPSEPHLLSFAFTRSVSLVRWGALCQWYFQGGQVKPPGLTVGCSFNIQCLQLPPGRMLKIGCCCLVLRERGEDKGSPKRFPKAFCNPSPAGSGAKPWGFCLCLPHGLSFKPASPVWSCAGSQLLRSSVPPCVTSPGHHSLSGHLPATPAMPTLPLCKANQLVT